MPWLLDQGQLSSEGQLSLLRWKLLILTQLEHPEINQCRSMLQVIALFLSRKSGLPTSLQDLWVFVELHRWQKHLVCARKWCQIII